MRVIDCFTFFNEFDLLEIRLKYLYEHVDYFVIVEADQSFTGEPKPLGFNEHSDRYQAYSDKIIYLPCKMPAFKKEHKKSTAWKREAYQRNYLMQGLQRIGVTSSDRILIGDIDEIVNLKVLENVKSGSVQFDQTSIKDQVLQLMLVFAKLPLDIFSSKKENSLRFRQLWLSLTGYKSLPILLRMDNHYYFVNNRERKKNIWKGTLLMKCDVLKYFVFEDMRELRRFPCKWVENGGWHFSYLGGKEIIKYKLRNFSHQEYNVAEIVNDQYINFCIENGYSLFDYYKNKSAPPQFEKVSIDSFPSKLRRILSDYDHLVYN